MLTKIFLTALLLGAIDIVTIKAIDSYYNGDSYRIPTAVFYACLLLLAACILTVLGCCFAIIWL